MNKKLFGILSIFLIALTIISPTVSANSNQKKPPYTIAPILPSNQDKGINNYISISSSKDTLNQKLQFLVSNNQSQSIGVKIQAVNGLTSPNGVIQYIASSKEKNSKLINKDYAFRNYVTVNDQISVPGGTSKIVTANVEMPKQKGTVLGGLAFEVKNNEVNQNKDDQFHIENKVSNIIGVSVNFPSNEKTLLKIGQPYIDVMPAYYAIRVPTTQATPYILKGVKLSYVVNEFEGKRIFSSKDTKEYDFAPRSKANIPIPWEAEKLVPKKKYVIKGTYELQNGKEFKFEKVFEYNPKTSFGDKVKDFVQPVLEGGFNWLWFLLLLLPILYILYKKRNVYILFSDNMEILEEIYCDNAIYELVEHVTEAENTENMLYKHYYKRRVVESEDEEKEKEYYYEYQKTKKVNVTD